MDLAGVGDVVRAARRAAGLSQKDLARLAGISRATLNYLENEPETDMGAIKLLAVLDVLGIRLSLAGPMPAADEAAVDAALKAVPKKERLSRAEIVEALVTGRPPVGQESALAQALDQVPVPVVVAAVRLAAQHGEVDAKLAWKHACDLARTGGSNRPAWGK